jgi:trimeric autotransporter adhesin
MAPAVLMSGDASRTCMPSGQWSGVDATCARPDPCLQQPCLGASSCLRNDEVDAGYVCQCIADAFGTPGPDGRGCIIPSIAVASGNLSLTVADGNDISFTLGSDSHSILSLDARINAITDPISGLVDSTVSTAINALSVSVDSRVSTAQSNTISTVMAEISRQAASTAAAASSDATTKANNAVALASADATTKANAALASATSTSTAGTSVAVAQLTSSMTIGNAQTLSSAVVQVNSVSTALTASISTNKALAQTWDSQTLSSAAANTESVRVTLSSQTSATAASLSAVTAQHSVSFGASFTTVNANFAALSTALAATQSCQVLGMLYDSGTSTCKYAKLTVTDWSGALPCGSTTRGDIRFDGTNVVVCDGTVWRASYTQPVGSLANPASSCSAVTSSYFSMLGNGYYYLRMSDNSVAPVACESATSRGSDGSTTVRVASSCATAWQYFKVQTGFVYVDKTGATTPTQANAILVLCMNGVSLGGDGSTAALSSTSCSALTQTWGKASGMYYVNSVLT